MFIKVFAILTLLLSFGNLTGNMENSMYQKEYFDTGETKSKGWVYNGIKTGYWRFYHRNGKLAAKGHFRKGKRVDYWYFYSKKGNLQKEGHYLNGTKANWWQFYDSYGRLIHKCQLNKGKKDGYCLMYRNNDIVKAEKYKNGKRLKAWTSFSSFKKENKLSDLR